MTLFEGRRVLQQTAALTQKNLLTFYKTPVTSVIRALVLPVIIALILSYLQEILATKTGQRDGTGDVTTPWPIKTLAEALMAAPELKLVFVRNGLLVNPLIDSVTLEIGQSKHVTVDDPNDLFLTCLQSLQGTSDCFAAVIFTTWNQTNVEYILATRPI